MAGDERNPSEKDRRFEPRVPARLEVRFSDAESAARVLQAFSINLSTGGICLRTRRRYDVGARLHLSLDVAGERCEIDGEVAWVRDGAIGVRFTGLSSEVRLRLQRVIDSTARSGTP